jgi:hypothetical protein
MKIQDEAKVLVELRNQIDEKKNELDELKLERDMLTERIMVGLKQSGFKSVKTDEATISIQTTKTLRIVNESALIKDLKKKKLNDYVKEQIDKTLWMPFSRQAVKEGIKLAGTELNETEFISVRKAGTKEVEVEDSGSLKES